MTHIIDTAIWYAGVLFIGLGALLGMAVIALFIVALLIHLCDHIAKRGKFLRAFADWYWQREMLAAARRDIANGAETQESEGAKQVAVEAAELRGRMAGERLNSAPATPGEG